MCICHKVAETDKHSIRLVYFEDIWQNSFFSLQFPFSFAIQFKVLHVGPLPAEYVFQSTGSLHKIEARNDLSFQYIR